MDFQGKVVLLVEDEPSVRNFVKTVLRRDGLETIEADDGIDGFNLLHEFGQNIALIVTDIRMPRLDGVSFVESARELFPTMPVLFMTGYTSAPPESPLRDFVVLRKPFPPKTLIKNVRKLIAT